MTDFQFNLGSELEEIFELQEKKTDLKEIVIHNDDHNTFDFVIEALEDVCGHEPEQATQCTYIIHYKGKCSVKRGTIAKLKPMCNTLQNKGLTAEIQ